MARVYGYCRISTMKQRLERQIENIKAKYPDAVIITEEYTGTTTDRPAWGKLAAQLREGDTVVFDEVSRMSRNAAEGFDLYQDLFNRGVNLIFLKEPHINTEVYKSALDRHIDIEADTGRAPIDKYINGQGQLLNDLLLDLAREQIEIAFRTAQQEVDYLHKRTSEGVRRAKERYLKEEALGLPHEKELPGRAQGSKITTKKSRAAKLEIIDKSWDFGGTLSDKDVIKLTGLARNTYYKYKREIFETLDDIDGAYDNAEDLRAAIKAAVK